VNAASGDVLFGRSDQKQGGGDVGSTGIAATGV
jgi:hypothetical protein